jgi:hypothetical protein
MEKSRRLLEKLRGLERNKISRKYIVFLLIVSVSAALLTIEAIFTTQNRISSADAEIVQVLHRNEKMILSIKGVLGAGIARSRNGSTLGIALYVVNNMSDFREIPNEIDGFNVFSSHIWNVSEYEKANMVVNSRPAFVLGQIQLASVALAILLIPFFIIISRYLANKHAEENRSKGIGKFKPLMIFVYVVPFACWGFDVITTFYAINVLGIASEINPLGWPLGAIGPLIFYTPTLVFTFLLLFKANNRHSVIVAAVLTILALTLGLFNLYAGVNNVNLIRDFINWKTN